MRIDTKSKGMLKLHFFLKKLLCRNQKLFTSLYHIFKQTYAKAKFSDRKIYAKIYFEIRKHILVIRSRSGQDGDRGIYFVFGNIFKSFIAINLRRNSLKKGVGYALNAEGSSDYGAVDYDGHLQVNLLNDRPRLIDFIDRRQGQVQS